MESYIRDTYIRYGIGIDKVPTLYLSKSIRFRICFGYLTMVTYGRYLHKVDVKCICGYIVHAISVGAELEKYSMEGGSVCINNN